MALVAPGPPKLCRLCGFKRPRSDFYARVVKGGVYASALCKQHDIQRSIARAKADPERERARQRAVYERRRQDPERLAIIRDQSRESKRRTLGIAPERYRVNGPRSSAASGGDVLDPVPFAAWLRSLGTNAETIGLACGLSASQVRKYLKGERAVVLDVVDRALLEANTVTTLDDLYPIGE